MGHHICGWLVCMIVVGGSSQLHAEWAKLPALPDKEGFAGSFVGVSHDVLLYAGGANFPERKPWEGGTKVWTDRVYALASPTGEWKKVGTLPRPLGYGVAVTYQNALICVGGSDARQHHADAFRLEWRDGQLHTSKLPALPKPIANMAGVLLNDTIYIVGGQEKPDAREALARMYSLNLAAKEPRWNEHDPLPTGRIFPVVAGWQGKVWVVGGASLQANRDGQVTRTYLQDAYAYEPTKGWSRVVAFPYPVAASPSPAPTNERGFVIIGGDDGSQAGVAHNKHRGFVTKMVQYDGQRHEWRTIGETPAPRVTVPCVRWHGSWVIPSGEQKPGIRSPEVWRWLDKNKE